MRQTLRKPSATADIAASTEPWIWTLAAVLVAGSLLAAALAWRQRRARRHQRSVGALLDGADELERLLYRLRDRMQRVQGVVERVPPDIGANAHASLDREDLIEIALRDLLEHRLWIQRCSQGASREELARALQAIADGRERIERELGRLDRAGRALERAADAAQAGTSDADPRRRA